MDKFLSLTLSGLVTGAIYSILASGLVLTYTTSGIFNFAHGAVAFATAYLYYQLNTGIGVPIVPALIISVFLFAPLLGLLLDRILLRRLAQAPVYARIVGTIGLLVALPALIQWLVLSLGNDVLDLGFRGNQAITEGASVPGIWKTPHDSYEIAGVALVEIDLWHWLHEHPDATPAELREAAVSLARTADPGTLSFALNAHRVAIWDARHSEERLAVSDEIISLGARARDPEAEIQGRNWRVVDLFELGQERRLARAGGGGALLLLAQLLLRLLELALLGLQRIVA